jgi:two-component system chemotaxis response regulator CheY
MIEWVLTLSLFSSRKEYRCSMPKTVVIVDDSTFIINTLTKFFKETMQFAVVGATTNGMEAINLYRSLKPDLLTLDIAMPVLNGFEVIEEIKKEFPDAKILIISAVRGDMLMDCELAGAADVIKKPLTINDPIFMRELVEIINRVVS